MPYVQHKDASLKPWMTSIEERIRALEANRVGPGALASAFIVTSEQTSSLSFTDLTTVGPTVPAYVGQSGLVVVLGGAQIIPSTGTAGGVVGLNIDGAGVPTAQILCEAVGNTWQGIGGTYVSGLTPGQHSFSLQYLTTGVPVNFGRRLLLVMPL